MEAVQSRSGSHNPTPPITVPYSEDGHHAESNVSEDIEYSLHPRYERPSPLEQFGRRRRPSISFNPEITLDTGAHLALEEPLRPFGDRNRIGKTHATAPSELHRLYTDSQIGHPLEQDVDQHHQHRYNRHHHGDQHSSHHRQIPHSPVSDAFSADTELPRPTSLTSLSTASPITEELRTPPQSRSEHFLSSFSSSPALHRPNSLDNPESWPTFGRHSLNNKEGHHFGGRKSSLRHPTRRGSRRSPSTSGKSPAGAFLSMWNRDDVVSQPDDEGQVVGSDYVLGKQIGYGGFSTVKEAFKVKDDGKTERSAVKIVKRHLANKTEIENDQAQAEFDHEVRIWRYLHHPNVLPLDAVYETDFATFCFTRLTTGGTLFELIRGNRQGLRLDHAKSYAYQLASAIRYMHGDARVLHRDVKLENCLIEPQGPEGSDEVSQLILCDFGMAEWMPTSVCSNTPDPYDNPADRPPTKNIGPSSTSTSVAGSLEYASPELLLSKTGVLDPAVDIWALGVVIYSLLVGSRPFQDPFQPRVQMNILSGQWNREAVLKDDGHLDERSEALELIEGCLEMDPVKRLTIAEIMACSWFRNLVDESELQPNHSRWGF